MEKLNTCRFADYTETVIVLLRRVTMVSVGVPAPSAGMEVVSGMEKGLRN